MCRLEISIYSINQLISNKIRVAVHVEISPDVGKNDFFLFFLWKRGNLGKLCGICCLLGNILGIFKKKQENKRKMPVF
jgi:hypothetical protein